MNTILFFFAIIYFCLPGLTLWLWLIKTEKSTSKIVNGICFSISLSFCSIFILSYISLNTFLIVWFVPFLFSLFYLFKNKYQLNIFNKTDEYKKLLLAVFSIAALLRFLPIYFSEYPHGWDPYFHLLLTEKILKFQTHIYDLLPFEDIPIIYNIGTHLFIAALSKLVHVESYIIFKLLIAFFGTLICLQIFVLLSTSVSKKNIVLFSTASYSLLALMGSIDYYGWGGLPNLIGMYFFLGSLAILNEPGYGEKMKYVLPSLFAGIWFSNQHTPVMVAIVMTYILFHLWAGGKKDIAKIIIISSFVALVIALPDLVPKIFNRYPTNETGLLQYEEPLHTLLFITENMGHLFFATTLCGLFFYFSKKKSFEISSTYKIICFFLVILFFIFEYGSRIFTYYMYGKAMAPLAPGRLLTDAVPFLALFSGIFFNTLKEKTGLSSKSVLAIIIILAMFNFNTYKAYFLPEVDTSYVDAYKWVKENTSENTLVLDEFVHAPLLTQRASFNTPLASSELWGRAKKRKLMMLIADQKIPASSAGVPVIHISTSPESVFPNTKMIWKHPSSELYIFEL